MTEALLDDVRARALRRLRPPPRLPLSEWMEGHLRLPDAVSAQPGRVRLWPFQRAIADAISDPAIERVTVKKAARVGYTTLLTGAVASYVANEPSPILLLLPTESDCRDYVVSDLEPVFEATPELAGILSGEQDESGRTTLGHKRFPGGFLKVVAAKSPRNLRRHTVRVLLIDEEDAMEVTPEGDPVDLAIKRTLSFPNRKIVRGSTPVDTATSTICREYDASDRRVFEFRCAECGEFSEPRWDHIRWDKDKPETAQWCCPACGTFVEERHKPRMVAEGRWRVTRTEVAGHAGFALNILSSPHRNAKWSRLAAEFLTVKDDPERLRTFRNTLLGESWDEPGETLDHGVLAARAKAFGLNVRTEDGIDLPLPAEVLLITIGVDVQDDRLEATVVGWSADDAAWVLGHFVIWGTPGEPQTWREMDELLLTRWTHPLGGKIGVDAVAVDSGDGGWTDEVYAFCWPRARRQVMAIKGMSGFSRPAIVMSKGKVARGTKDGRGRLYLVGADTIKRSLAVRLAGLGRSETIRFSASLPLVWFEQLTAERRAIRKVRGRLVQRFERIGSQAAEALDCMVYAIAARSALAGVDFEARAERLRTPEGARPSAAERIAALSRKWNG